MAHRPDFLASHVLRQSARRHCRNHRAVPLFSILASQRCEAAHRLGRRGHVNFMHRTTAAGADVGHRLWLVLGKSGIAARAGGCNVGRIPLCGDEGHRAVDPVSSVPRTGDQPMLGRRFRRGHRDVRNDYLPAAIHAGSAGRHSDAIGQSPDTDDAGHRDRNICMRADHNAATKLQNSHHGRLGTRYRGNDSLRSNGCLDAIPFRSGGNDHRGIRDGPHDARLYRRRPERGPA